ncbi:MAG: hypothetical protein LBE55_01005 [Clostridiales bacterium]|jgi:YjbE family integral membrane protein|nr:hypothetical protein [Clostridiales bacterium]
MSTLLQVVLINLIVSFDNISVIALAARGLTPKKANTARMVGIWLSLALKLVFTFMVGWLFTITWLHIRLIGGAMLIYVIIQMLRDTGVHRNINSDDKYYKVIFIIIAADISMSLDNVIAVISIVADEGGNVTSHGLSVAFLGFAISVPILLIASEYIINLINRHAVLFALAAGYLGYIAANMIFEDKLLESLFSFIRFPFAPQLAVAIGILVVYVSWLLARRNPRQLE